MRFVALDHAEPAFESAILTLPEASDELATARFCARSRKRAERARPVSAVRLAA